jgi:hypothetical protein
MVNLPLPEVLASALQGIVTRRLQHAYLHDVRGGLQALHSALELLSRYAALGPGSPQAEKAVALAKRTVANHEASIFDLVRHLAFAGDESVATNVGEIVRDATRILRNEAAHKSIRFELQCAPDAIIVTQPGKCRLFVLGLLIGLMDELESGSALHAEVRDSDGRVLVQLKSQANVVSVSSLQSVWLKTLPEGVSQLELALAAAGDWIVTNGGTLEVSHNAKFSVVQLSYPAA